MRFTQAGLALVAAVAVAVAALAVGPGGPRAGAGAPDPEAARIRAQLARAERALLASDVSHLGTAQRFARARLILALQAYRDRGVFPHNHDARDRVPLFVDRHGTPGVLAYLMTASGHPSLARRLTRTRNHADVHALEGDAEVRAWLDEVGLTLEEAAVLQTIHELQPPDDDHPPATPA